MAQSLPPDDHTMRISTTHDRVHMQLCNLFIFLITRDNSGTSTMTRRRISTRALVRSYKLVLFLIIRDVARKCKCELSGNKQHSCVESPTLVARRLRALVRLARCRPNICNWSCSQRGLLGSRGDKCSGVSRQLPTQGCSGVTVNGLAVQVAAILETAIPFDVISPGGSGALAICSSFDAVSESKSVVIATQNGSPFLFNCMDSRFGCLGWLDEDWRTQCREAVTQELDAAMYPVNAV